MPGSKYDLYLGDASDLKGYRCRSLARSSAPQVAPRFSSGISGPTDLDLLKSASVGSFMGGMFQRDWIDVTTDQVARVGGVFNKYDEMLYPAPRRSSPVQVSTTYQPLAKAESDGVSFMAYGMFSAGTYYNVLHKFTYAGGVSTVTLPAALASNGMCNITGLALHKKYLYVASQVIGGFSVVCHRYDIDADTWQNIAGGLVKFCSIRGVLYGINTTSQLFSCTSEDIAGSATYTVVDTAGVGNNDGIATDFVEYNGAGYIAKPDGVYRFDGVKATRILKLSPRQLCVFNGALYFFAGNWLYKFDGTNIIKLQYFGNQETQGSYQGAFMNLGADSDYLYINTVVTNNGYAITDKDQTVTSGIKRLYTFDGAAFHLWHETDVTLGPGYTAATLVTYNFCYDIFGTSNGSYVWTSFYHSFNKSFMFDPTKTETTSMLEFTTSEHDDGFPNIFKSLEKIEVDYQNIVSGDSILVKYQYYNGKDWSAWITAGTITSTTSNDIEITDSDHKLYKRLKVSVVVTPATDSTIAFKGASIRYTLQPRTRWRWEALLMAEGNGNIQDRAGDNIIGNANSFTNDVVRSIRQKTPIYMLSPDYTQVKTGVSDSATTIVLGGEVPIYTDPYTEYPLIAIKNSGGAWELLKVLTVVYDSGDDDTTITVESRGYLGITPASISSGAEVHLCFRVYATRLLRDAPVLDEKTYNEQDTGESQLQREFLLELVEV